LTSLPQGLSAAASSLRFIYDASIVELRIRCTMQVSICACRYTASMASGKPRRHINNNDQDVMQAYILQFVKDLQPELGALSVLIHMPSTSLRPSARTPSGR
jgi:hypothetical protein